MRVRAEWQQICNHERDAVITATLVATDLARLGAPPAILGLAARVIEDEVRHVEVCARVLDTLGATVVPPIPESTRSTLGYGEALESRCARALIAGFAVGDPLSAACFAAARSLAREPLLAWGYTELLRDEARHGHFGAKAGAWVIRDWTTADRQALWPDCVAEIEALERRRGGALPRAANGHLGARWTDRAAEALGVLRPEIYSDALVSAIPRSVLPNLQTLRILPQPPASPSLVH
ncbi:MAG TPA: ferritin-like domain-containing protein [Polyangia bacterium]|nr:ferritin-like domain-containing protein [Polyangia bacterium]